MPTTVMQATRPAVPPRNEAELTLIRRIAGGDRQAFETLYSNYARRLAGYLAKFLWQPELIEEVIDDVMLAVWQQASHFQPSARVSSWILGIAHYKALTARERLVRRASQGYPTPAAWSNADNPEERLSSDEDKRTLVAALGTLPPEQQAVVELTYYQGCSYQVIAGIMHCPVNTVKKRMSLARRRLASQLTQHHLP